MRSARRSVLLLGSLLLTALLFWRPPAPIHVDAEPDVLQPTRSVSALALLTAFAVIALASMLWLAAQQWSEASERYASARALTGGDPARAAPLMIRYGC